MSAGSQRSAARLAAVQALYQMDVTGKTLPDIFAEFESFWIGGEIEGERYNPAELAFFRDIVKGVLTDRIKGRSTIASTMLWCRRGLWRGSTASCARSCAPAPTS